MSTENKEADLKEMVEKMSAEITSKVSSQVEGVSNKISSFEKKLDSFKSVEDGDEDEDQDDDLVVSKKDLKKFLDERDEKIEKKITGSIKEFSNVSTKRGAWDLQVAKDFPMLMESDPFFNKDFHKDVLAEISQRKSDGIPEDDPRLVYDSAAAVFARKPKYQQLRKEHLDEEVRRANNRDGQFNIRGGRKEQTKELSDTQLDLAKRLGLDPSKVLERMKKSAI